MAITVHTGYPGAGKSHALVKDVIVPAVLNGRRVLTNVDGINPDAILGYCADRVDHADQLGSVEVFDGEEAKAVGFWPTEALPDTQTRVKGGDLVVFDEWRLYFPNRGKWPIEDVVKFMRWHRHLTSAKGVSTDVAIGTQLATDMHPDIRGLCERSYKYAKLRAVGMEKSYSWKVWQGHLQPKGEHFANGVGKYDSEIFPLYQSSAALHGTHQEVKTNRRDSIWSQPKTWVAVGAVVVLPICGLFGLAYAKDSMAPPKPPALAQSAAGGAPGAAGAQSSGGSSVQVSPWRIVGHIEGTDGMRVIVSDDSGAVRMLRPSDFDFDSGRPVSGLVDGKTAQAVDTMPSGPSPSLMGLVP